MNSLLSFVFFFFSFFPLTHSTQRNLPPSPPPADDVVRDTRALTARMWVRGARDFSSRAVVTGRPLRISSGYGHREDVRGFGAPVELPGSAAAATARTRSLTGGTGAVSARGGNGTTTMGSYLGGFDASSRASRGAHLAQGQTRRMSTRGKGYRSVRTGVLRCEICPEEVVSPQRNVPVARRAPHTWWAGKGLGPDKATKTPAALAITDRELTARALAHPAFDPYTTTYKMQTAERAQYMGAGVTA
jgi:hypothetical protein